MSELKPCPFCGGKAEVDTNIGGVVCENLCTNPNTFDGGGGVWTDDWNRRPIEDALRARIAELEAKQHWIPVSEPPKESGEYFTLTQVEGENFVGTAVYEKKHNHWWNDLGDRDDITHWMTLPEPPEDDNNEPA